LSLLMTILLVAAIGILVIAFGYTWSLAKNQKNVKGELDSEIPEGVQKSPYIRNPIFLTYILFFLLLILTIIFSALAINW
jgi:ammonia channel protein AmtB